MALRDKMRANAQPHLEPGETIQVVFGSQTHSQWLIAFTGLITGLLFNRYVLVVVTDRRIFLGKSGALTMSKCTEVLASLPRQTQIGPASGLWHKTESLGRKLYIHRRFHSDIADADRLMSAGAPAAPPALGHSPSAGPPPPPAPAPGLGATPTGRPEHSCTTSTGRRTSTPGPARPVGPDLGPTATAARPTAIRPTGPELGTTTSAPSPTPTRPTGPELDTPDPTPGTAPTRPTGPRLGAPAPLNGSVCRMAGRADRGWSGNDVEKFVRCSSLSVCWEASASSREPSRFSAVGTAPAPDRRAGTRRSRPSSRPEAATASERAADDQAFIDALSLDEE